MKETNMNIGQIGFGAELYNEVQRLICDWMGRDAGEQTAMVPQLVQDIVRVVKCHNGPVLATAAHDGPELP